MVQLPEFTRLYEKPSNDYLPPTFISTSFHRQIQPSLGYFSLRYEYQRTLHTTLTSEADLTYLISTFGYESTCPGCKAECSLRELSPSDIFVVQLPKFYFSLQEERSDD